MIEPLRDEPDYPSVDLSRLERANIGRRYYNVKLHAINDDLPHKKKLLDYVASLPTAAQTGDGLLLLGGHGQGKTAAACRILAEAMARAPLSPYFVLAQNLDHYAMHRDVKTEDGASIWRMITRDAQFLVIDDLAAERDTTWTSQWVELVLTERYHWMLPTIITSNSSEAEVTDRYPRVGNLVGDAYRVIEMAGANWRD